MLGLNTLKTYAAAALLALASWTGAASASTVDCGIDQLSSEDATISCYDSGTKPNFLDTDLLSSIRSDGYIYYGTIRPTPIANTSGFGDMMALLGDTSGAFDVDEAVDAILVFGMAPTSCTYVDKCAVTYAAFEVTTTAGALLEWASSSATHLTHVTIYLKPAAVPVPAAGLLLVGALGALGLARRRRKAA